MKNKEVLQEFCPNNKCGLPAIAIPFKGHWHESLEHPRCNITNWFTKEDLEERKQRLGEIKFK